MEVSTASADSHGARRWSVWGLAALVLLLIMRPAAASEAWVPGLLYGKPADDGCLHATDGRLDTGCSTGWRGARHWDLPEPVTVGSYYVQTSTSGLYFQLLDGDGTVLYESGTVTQDEIHELPESIEGLSSQSEPTGPSVLPSRPPSSSTTTSITQRAGSSEPRKASSSPRPPGRATPAPAFPCS